MRDVYASFVFQTGVESAPRWSRVRTLWLFIAAAWQGSDAEIFSRIVSLRCSPAECGKTLFCVSRAHPDQDGLA